MNRIILIVFVTGSIMWGLTEVCSYAAVPEHSEANEAKYSVCSASPHFANRQIEFFGKDRRRVENNGVSLFSEVLLVDYSYKESLLLAKKGNFCQTDEGGCRLRKARRIGVPCSCPNSDGFVINEDAGGTVTRNSPMQSGNLNDPNEPEDIKINPDKSKGRKVIPEDKEIEKK